MKYTLPTRRGAVARRCCTPVLLAVLMALLLAPIACKRKTVRVGSTDEETPRMQSVLMLGDPKIEPQLINGFHGIDDGAWRWTEKQFTVALRPPFGSEKKGAKLTVK